MPLLAICLDTIHTTNYWGQPERSGETAMKYFICVLGLVLVVEGLPYMTYPDRTKAYLRKLVHISDATLRVLGLAAVATGLILVYFGTR